MKNILLLIVFILSLNNVQSQLSIDWAIDFTVTDLEEDTINLFSILEDEQWVIINFGAYWCAPCQDYAENFGKIYEEFGCNTGDFFFIEMDSSGTDAQCENFINTYGGGYDVPYICNASDIYDLYDIPYYPTIIIIDSNGFIRNDEVWPEYLSNFLHQYAEIENLSLGNCNNTISIEELNSLNTQNNKKYDIFGRELKTIQNNSIYIQNNKKHIKIQ